MSKELEALKIGIPKLKKLYENSAKKMSSNDILGFDLTFSYLDKALQRLESIENSKPSEALEYLEKLGKYELQNCFVEDLIVYDLIKHALLKEQELEEENNFLSNTIKTVNNQYISLMSNYQEQKRVLDILFKKEVDINLLSRSIDSKSYNYSYAYVKGYDFSANKEITEEEYDLLTRYYNDRT